MPEAMMNSSIVSALQQDEPIDRGKEIRSSHIYHKIVASMEVDIETDGQSRTELDSHANMPVVGREAQVVEQSGRTVEVSPFTPDYKPIKVEVVNAIIQYDSPLDGKEYILVVQNAFRVPSMSNNLIPPFIMHGNGIMVNESAKIHCEDPTRHDHAIIFKGYDLCIPLRLHGVFSYFVMRKPDVELALDMNEPTIYAKEIYTLTPTKCYPHTDVYALNEESIVDWEGNIKEKGRSDVKIVLDETGDEYQSRYQVSTMEALHMDKVIQSRSQCNNINICPVTTSKFVAATPIRKHLENKATSPIYAISVVSVVLFPRPQGPLSPQSRSPWSCSLSRWVLKSNGNVVPRHSVRALQLAEIRSDTEKR